MLKKLLVFFIIMYLKLVYTTLRIEKKGMEQWDKAVMSDQPLITLFWHGRLLGIPLLDAKHRTPKGIISRHGDGDLIAKVMYAFNIGAIRGSSNRLASDPKGAKNRGGSAAVKGALNELKKGTIIGITPDGPKGPYQRIKPNIIPMAQQANAMIICVCFHAKWAIHFNSWDKFMLPLPFSRAALQASDIITLKQHDDAEITRQYIETMMQKQQKDYKI